MHVRKKIEKFGDTDPRFRHLGKELNLRMRSTKESAPPPRFFKVHRGRRKFCEYLCKGCPKKFDTYSMKRDHQKHCLKRKSPVTVPAPIAVPQGDQHVLARICMG